MRGVAPTRTRQRKGAFENQKTVVLESSSSDEGEALKS